MLISKIQSFMPNNTLKKISTNNHCNSYSELRMSKPLEADTVSFKATPKAANKLWEINKSDASDIHRALKPAEKKLVHFIESNFSDLIVSTKEPKNPIYAIKHRLKSVNSIKEKSGTRQWFPQEVIENMTDLLGMKFEFRTSNQQDIERVLDRFIPLIRSRKIELLEIENKRPGILENGPKDELTKYDYASIKFLKKMISIQEEVWNKGQKGAKKQEVGHILEHDFTPMNYNAIHMLFRIPGKNPLVFELQIMGNDMAAGKNIDDKVFKLLNGKSIDNKYSEVKKIFEPFTNKNFFDKNETNTPVILDNAKSIYKKYRQQVFLFQREKEPLPYTKKKKVNRFLPLQYKLFPTDIELKYDIHSSDFDYNYLQELIEKADRKADREALKTIHSSNNTKRKTNLKSSKTQNV